MKITQKTVPWMPVGWKMQNIVFTEKCIIFLMVHDHCVQNFPYKFQAGFTYWERADLLAFVCGV